MSKRKVIDRQVVDPSVHCQALLPPALPCESLHSEIVLLIQQLKQRSELGDNLVQPEDPSCDLDIRVLPQALAALAARRRA